MTADETSGDPLGTLRRESAEITAALIQIDSTNTGDPATISDGESRCAELIRELLSEAGYEGQWCERTPGRGNLVVRIAGTDPAAPALLIHAHTDVVPADPALWRADPFGGEIIDGELWGRGAVDMKNMIGMLLAAIRSLGIEGWQPRRDIVLAFVADEEVEGADGMAYLVAEHPELFRGVTEAIGEVGGFSFEAPTGRNYAIGIGEKGVAWATLRARGVEGHGSLIPNSKSALARLTAALARITAHSWPLANDPATDTVLTHLGDALGSSVSAQSIEQDLVPLGPVAPMFSSAFRTSSALTQVHAGSKTNTVPGIAMATVDCRIAPGYETEFHRVFAELVGPDVEVSWESAPSVTAEYDTELVAAVCRAITAVDPGARAIPFVTGGATDAKALSRRGIRCYGFVPLCLPAGFNFPGMFHGIDERVPVASLETGAVILRELLLSQ
ncbi:M20/M25/M40 family metallo-hydrolase [Leucobacter insecticola]|uniref:M20/M25/M40 family metallo-hydrolase n=1 Tax=Leucobacter insecticola TaxID=2714934 RepID=A0A6G8FHL3_9MICO|nr:M20/M25/M40 family metallo-hydrolase [Leucobacter insecticola]QIM15986.1 M20/M25/M40 family metallo-hydrolase [Leucobacter insecticola]